MSKRKLAGGVIAAIGGLVVLYWPGYLPWEHRVPARGEHPTFDFASRV